MVGRRNLDEKGVLSVNDREPRLPSLPSDRLDDALSLHPLTVVRAGEQLTESRSRRIGQCLRADDPGGDLVDHRREISRPRLPGHIDELAGRKAVAWIDHENPAS